MTGLDQRQSDAVFEVMARYEGFVKWMARSSQHQDEGDCVHCQAQQLLDDCREIIRGPRAA